MKTIFLVAVIGAHVAEAIRDMQAERGCHLVIVAGGPGEEPELDPGAVLKLEPISPECGTDCVVLEKEVRHVTATTPARSLSEPRTPSFWIGCDRRWG